MTARTRIRERECHARGPAHETALACLEAGIEAAHPGRVVRDAVDRDGARLSIDGEALDLTAFDRVLALGGGKAAAGVAAALEEILDDALDGGAVVTDDPGGVETETVEVLPGAHPVPDAEGVASARRVLDLAESADERTLVLAVITGGGSALLAAPAVPLEAMRAVTDALLESGADIHDINAVRKHLSTVKGGGLAAAAAPARLVTLAFSDVVGDDLDVIASGPTVPDATTYADARAVLDRDVEDVPEAVADRLAAGERGEHSETPDSGDPVFERTSAHILANGFTALAAAREVAQSRGYEPLILSSRIRGEAREAAGVHLAVAEEVAATGNPADRPAVVLSGGETTVEVRGDGTGGPNQEFCLQAALDIGVEAVCAAVDTDGRDGSTDAAGALVDADTVEDHDAARAALADNDATPFLRERGALVETGRTGTNVNDLRVLVVE
jgi:hydroxypyruvate reductase